MLLSIGETQSEKLSVELPVDATLSRCHTPAAQTPVELQVTDARSQPIGANKVEQS